MVLRDSGREGRAGADESVDVGVAALVMLEGTAAEDVAPAPARSQGLGGDAPDIAWVPQLPPAASCGLLVCQGVGLLLFFAVDVWNVSVSLDDAVSGKRRPAPGVEKIRLTMSYMVASAVRSVPRIWRTDAC